METFESRPPSHRAPDPDEGVLAVSVSLNSGAVGQLDTLTVEGASARYQLRSVSNSAARDLSVFVGVVPQGEYHVHALSDRDTFTSKTLTKTERDAMGSFRVEAGRVTDLGRIVLTPFGLSVITGRSATLTSNEALVKLFAPDSADAYARATPLKWMNERSADDIAESYARSYPVGATSFVELQSGEVVAATRMGTVLVRGVEGRWSAARTDELHGLLTVKPTGRSSEGLIAAGEFNTIVRLQAGKLHKLDAGRLPFGNILFINGDDKNGWYIAHQRAQDIRILRTDSLDKPNWSEVASARTGFDFWSGAKNFWIWSVSGGFAYAVTDRGTLRYFDFATRAFTERHTPSDNAIITLAPSPNDVLGVITSPGGGFGGVTASAYITRDRGATWIPVKSPYSVKVAAPRVLADGTWLQNGGVFATPGCKSARTKARRGRKCRIA